MSPRSPDDRAFHQVLARTPRPDPEGRVPLASEGFADRIFELTHTEFPPQHAEAVWHEIRGHRRDLSAALGRDVGDSVAAHDYLRNFRRDFPELVVVPDALLRGVVEAATRDELTGLMTRASGRARLESELRRTERYGTPVSVLLIDVDHFKRVNDRDGHIEGDRVLAEVARIIAEQSRSTDVVARYGGEEFLVVAPGIAAAEGVRTAERLGACVRHQQRGATRVTVSLGVVTVVDGRELDEVVGAADKALYRAKRTGRDRACGGEVVGA